MVGVHEGQYKINEIQGRCKREIDIQWNSSISTSLKRWLHNFKDFLSDVHNGLQ